MLMAAVAAGSLVTGEPRWEAISACFFAIASAGILLAAGAMIERSHDSSTQGVAHWLMVGGSITGGLSWAGVAFFGLSLGTPAQATIVLAACTAMMGLSAVACADGAISHVAFASPLAAMLVFQLGADPERGGVFAASLVVTIFLMSLWARATRGAGAENFRPEETVPAGMAWRVAADVPRRFSAAEFGRPVRVLVVLEDPSVLRQAETMFGERGHEVTTAWDFANALRLAGERPFDLALLQASPAIQVETVENLRCAGRPSEAERLAIIGFAGHPGEANWCEHAGLDGMLNKPLTAESLDLVLGRVLGTRAGRPAVTATAGENRADAGKASPGSPATAQRSGQPAKELDGTLQRR
jgi:CheY-like chemotaxis protein